MNNGKHTEEMGISLNSKLNVMMMETYENAQSAAICSMNEQERRLLFVSILDANEDVSTEMHPSTDKAA